MMFYLIKNNLKMMLRNKWIALVLIIGPVLTIAVLSSAFEELLNSYEGVDAFYVGYRISEGHKLSDSMEMVKDIAEDYEIYLTEYPDGEPQVMMSKNDLAGFVVFQEDSYVLYKAEEHMVEGITLEYFISKMMNRMSGIDIGNVQQQIPESIEAGKTETLSSQQINMEENETKLETASLTLGEERADMTLEEMNLPVTLLPFMPAIDSKDYYGIAFIVYFIWCGIACLSPILSSEKKNGIENRFRVSTVSGGKVYLARWVSVSIVQVFGTLASILICVALFGINWGNIPWSALILLLSILASNAFSLMIYYLFKNLAVTIVVVWSTVWFMGLAGGSFETYMFSKIAQWIKELSPIYYINRTLVEYSCMGNSDYTQPCIAFLLALTVVCSVGAVLAERARRLCNK